MNEQTTKVTNATNGIWKFFIDVGGTFTDCLAVSPTGKLQQMKVLSGGQTKGRFESSKPADSNGRSFQDVARTEPDQFWNQAIIRLFDERGNSIAESTVQRFVNQNGESTFFLDDKLADSIFQQAHSYELSTPWRAPILAIHRLTGIPISKSLPACQINLGTTRGTNALLTRTGAKTAFLTTAGFGDLLKIGDQTRLDLFDLIVRKLKPLADISIEVDERILADGKIEQPIDRNIVHDQLLKLKSDGFESIAVCLMHGYRFQQHEKIIAEIAKGVGFAEVRISCEVAPLIKILDRAETTVLDAYINPVLRTYLDEIENALFANSKLLLMTSAGGLVSRDRFSGKDSLLSGPAGGVVGAARVAEQIGINHVIGFDMGGTSTDVSRYDGKFQREYESRKAGVRIVAPAMAIETVAAGGGSICHFDGTRQLVGPQSAGNEPGPACYGRGGPLTVTDINLFLGRFSDEQFPFPLDRVAAERQLTEIRDQMLESGIDHSLTSIAQGFLDIANHKMAAAIQNVSVARGYDPRQYTMVSFGGAAGQHCCAVANHLDIRKILVHPYSSLLSAVGIQMADQTSQQVKSVLQPLGDWSVQKMSAQLNRLSELAIAELESAGCSREDVRCEYSLELRYQGTEPVESIELPTNSVDWAEFDLADAFRRLHQQRYGYIQDRPLQVVTARVNGVVAGNSLAEQKVEPTIAVDSKVTADPIGDEKNITLQKLQATANGWNCYSRQSLLAGQVLSGPALVMDDTTSVVIDSGWQLHVLQHGQWLLHREEQSDRIGHEVEASLDESDPVQLEIFNQHFVSIAAQMGSVLQRTSASVNVKERLDFSCALFTSTGDLVVNAPHIPVHLGAMSETVRSTIKMNPQVNAGDVFVTNDPYAGGSHLPDITVVSPVFENDSAGRSTLVFWVASRSHHAEIGGKAPGSMPADAICLAEEGVLIQNFKLLDQGVSRFDEMETLLKSGRWPSRNPGENIADLKAQVAANRCGQIQLQQLVKTYGTETVEHYMQLIQRAARQSVRAALQKIPDGEYECVDQMDNGRMIRLLVRKKRQQIEFDFSGTDPVSPDNLNANRAIVTAAVMYVVRSLCAHDIPLNQGLVKDVSITLPDCFLNAQAGESPETSPAIVGGNVETSQRVVDVILRALHLSAASHGTMNNWLIGNDTFGYYETVGGGSAAGPGFHGCSAVHCHMTNTRLTDAEILETRYPLVLRQFSERANSGGRGEFDGGNGMVRRIEFRSPLTVSLLTSRRVVSPPGHHGGGDGSRGKNTLIDENGKAHSLASQCQVEVQPGQQLLLETPGGGGWGIPPN